MRISFVNYLPFFFFLAKVLGVSERYGFCTDDGANEAAKPIELIMRTERSFIVQKQMM